MKIILLENIKRIGSIGEVIEVKRGFARKEDGEKFEKKEKIPN